MGRIQVCRANDSHGPRGLHSCQDEREAVVEANRPVRGAREGVASRSPSAVAVNTCPGWASGHWYGVDDRDHSKLAREAIVLSSAGGVRRAVAWRGGNVHFRSHRHSDV